MSDSCVPLMLDPEEPGAIVHTHISEECLVSKSFLTARCLFLGLYIVLVVWSLAPGDTVAVYGASIIGSIFLAALCLFLGSYIALAMISLSRGDDVCGIFATTNHAHARKPDSGSARNWICSLLGVYIILVIWSLSPDFAEALWHILAVTLFLWAACVVNGVTESTALPSISIGFLTALCLGLGVYITALICFLAPSDAVAIFGSPTISASLLASAPRILAIESAVELVLLAYLYAFYFGEDSQEFLSAVSIGALASFFYGGVFYLILSLPGPHPSASPVVSASCITMVFVIECSAMALSFGRDAVGGRSKDAAEYELRSSTSQDQEQDAYVPISFV